MKFIAQIRLPYGGTTYVRVPGDNYYEAQQISEAQYGRDQVICVVSAASPGCVSVDGRVEPLENYS